MVELILSETKQVDISEDIIDKLSKLEDICDLDIEDWAAYDKELGDIWEKDQTSYKVRIYTDKMNKFMVNDYFDKTYQCNRKNIIDLGDKIIFKITEDRRICVMLKDSLMLYKNASEYSKPLELMQLTDMSYNKIGAFVR